MLTLHFDDWIFPANADSIDCTAINWNLSRMASITIRNLDEELKARLRMVAAQHGNSMEEEVRVILRSVLSPTSTAGLGSRIRARFAEVGGVELELPSRSDMPRDPDIGG